MAFAVKVIVFCGVLLNLFGVGQASICSGEDVILTCFSNTSSFLAWNITFPDETNQRSELRYISSTGHSTCQAPRTAFHTVFQFVRTSIAPLISTLAVYNMSSSLNGMRVTCLDAEDNYSTISSSIINVTQNDIRVQSPFLETNEQLGTENITVILRWTEDRGALYESVVLPQAFKIISTTSIVLTLQYNVLYNVSVAVSLCGHISIDKLKLNYVKCSYPLNLSSNESVMIASYRDPALVGSMLQFRCKDRLFPSDVLTAVCSEDGRWYPDPTKQNCTMSVGLSNSMLNSETLIATVTSSIASFVFGSLIFHVIGCICGYRLNRHQRNRMLRPHATEVTRGPVQLYEEIPQLHMQPSEKDNEVTLNENLAYDSLHP